MAEFTSYEPGTPSWIDLATTDLEAAKGFYVGLFGWTAADTPSPEGIYTMFSKEGALVAAAYEMSADMIENQIPPHWATYITVANVEESLATVQANGGSIVQPVHEIPGSGRMAAVQDPAAAVFALWEPHGHIGAQRANEPGALIWNELQNYDTAAAAVFYEAVFGWSAQVSQMPAGGEYTSFMLGDRPVAGMMAIQPEWGPVPPNWSVYIGVADAQVACDYAAAHGGGVEFPPMDVTGVGSFALLRDPQGAYFYAMEPAP
ncbi:MAG: VOC family protein [Acidimicrobiia bacterium]|nr:VOC family protein [Acidimicrobiia bacterium]